MTPTIVHALGLRTVLPAPKPRAHPTAQAIAAALPRDMLCLRSRMLVRDIRETCNVGRNTAFLAIRLARKTA